MPQVVDDVVNCKTTMDEKCEDMTIGYTTIAKCSKWPREECFITKNTVKKFSPVSQCRKEPKQFCAPAGCGFTQVIQFHRQETYNIPAH